MQELLQKLGIDWRLLLSQVVNFLLLIIILRAFAYKPILAILKKRQEKIREGILKAERADERLEEAGVLASEKLKSAEREGLILIRDAEGRAKKEEVKLIAKAHKKEEAILKSAEEVSRAKAEEARREVEKEAAMLVRQAIAKTVELSPDVIDEKLIKDAISRLARTKQ